MKVAFVDPSKFSYPYDHLLLNELSKFIEVGFFTSEFQHGVEYDNKLYEEVKVFYPCSSRLRKRNPVWKRLFTPLKAFEHVVSSLALLCIVKFFGYTVVHYQWCPVPGFDRLMLKIHKLLGGKVFFTAHNLLPHDSGQKYIRSYSDIYSTVDHIFVHTEATRCGLINEFGVNPEKVVLVKHGHFDYLNNLRVKNLTIKEQGLVDFCNRHADSTKLLVFGLVRQYKGLHNALVALSQLVSEGGDYSLCVLGKFKDEKYRALIMSMIADLRLEDRIFITDEFVEESNIAYLSKLSDVAIFPYEQVDQSGALLAMASVGMPIVAAEHDGFRQVVRNGVNGQLYSREEPVGGLVAALSGLEKNKIDEYSVASFNIAIKDFSWVATAAITKDTYSRAKE